MEDGIGPRVGQIVRVLRGRDAGQYAIVVRTEDRFVYIADGDKRKFDRPKKKNVLHLQLTNSISSEVVNSIRETGRVTNGKLRFALNRYLAEKLQDAQEKGE
jgi:ribosomal protein L14E/L6E/L27E